MNEKVEEKGKCNKTKSIFCDRSAVSKSQTQLIGRLYFIHDTAVRVTVYSIMKR